MKPKEFKAIIRQAAAGAFFDEFLKFQSDFLKDLHLYCGGGGNISLWSTAKGDSVMDVKLRKLILDDIATQDNFDILEDDLKDYEEYVAATKKRIAKLKKEFAK